MEGRYMLRRLLFVLCMTMVVGIVLTIANPLGIGPYISAMGLSFMTQYLDTFMVSGMVLVVIGFMILCLMRIIKP